MIIGLTGKAQSGKDTACRIIRKILPQAERKAFADPLKESVCALFGLTRQELDAWKLDSKVHVQFVSHVPGMQYPMLMNAPLTMRELLQRYGCEAHREIFGEDFWLEVALPSREYYQNKIVVVSDVRFDNEARHIRTLGGIVISISRPGMQLDVGGGHPSEADIDPIFVNYVVVNEGTVDDLEVKLNTLLRKTNIYAG